MKYYAIRRGRTNNIIVRSWFECSELVTGHPGAIFKSFTNESQAVLFAKSKPIKQHKIKGYNYSIHKLNKGECLLRGRFLSNPRRCLTRSFGRTIGYDYKESGNSMPFNI